MAETPKPGTIGVILQGEPEGATYRETDRVKARVVSDDLWTDRAETNVAIQRRTLGALVVGLVAVWLALASTMG